MSDLKKKKAGHVESTQRVGGLAPLWAKKNAPPKKRESGQRE